MTTPPGDRRRELLHSAKIYVLVDGGTDAKDFSGRVISFATAGADVIQLREKRLSDRVLFERACLLRELLADQPTLAVVNDRPDIALLAGADGVHVGQKELPVCEVRQLVRDELIIGLSTHSIDQASSAQMAGVDYIGVGPTFPSRTKSFERFTGLDLLSKVAAEISIPAFAIGGIDLENVDSVVSAGMHRIAVASVVRHAENAGEVIRELRRRVSDPRCP